MGMVTKCLRVGGFLTAFVAITAQAAIDLSGYSAGAERPVTILRGDLSPAQSNITITRPGLYRLTGNMSGLTGSETLITISASDVELDLGGSTLKNAATGIVVSSGVARVKIQNGAINNMSTIGLQVLGSQCSIENLEVSQAGKGISVSGGVENSFKNCRVMQAKTIGIELLSTSTNSFVACDVLQTASTAATNGIFGNGGSDNSFDGCTVKDVSSNGGVAYGMRFLAMNRTYVTNCSICDVVATTNTAKGLYIPSGVTQCFVKNNNVQRIWGKSTSGSAANSDGTGIDVVTGSSFLGYANYLADNVSGMTYITSLSTPGASYLNVDQSLIKAQDDDFRAGFNIDMQKASPGTPAETVIRDTNTKVDSLLTSNSIIESIVEGLDLDLNQIPVIYNVVATTESKLDECCFSSNSKLDLLQTTVDTEFGQVFVRFNQVDTALQSLSASELDHFVTTFTTLVQIGDELLYTMTEMQQLTQDVMASLSDLDQILNVVNQLDVDLAAHNATITSMLDVLETDVAVVDANVLAVKAIGLTTESKLDVLSTEVGVIDGKIDIIDTNVDAIKATGLTTESKLDVCCLTMGSKLDALSTEVGVVDGKVNIIDTNVDSLLVSNSIIESVVENLNLDLTPVENAIAAVQNIALTTESKLDVLAVEVGVINGKVDIIDTNVDAIKATGLTTESKLDACCSTMSSKLDALSTEVGVINGKVDIIDTNVDTINTNVLAVEAIGLTTESKLDACCLTMGSKLDVVIGGEVTSNSKLDVLISDDRTVESKLDILVAGVACEATPLTTASAVGGVIVLSTPGNYCMASDIGSLGSAVTVSCVADNVCLCMNNRELIGRIQAYGDHTIVKNGKVTVPTSASLAKPFVIYPTATNSTVSNVAVVVLDGGVSNANLNALEIQANDVIVENSSFIGGNTGGGYSGDGGHGIYCNGCLRTTIHSVEIIGTSVALAGVDGDGIRVGTGCSLIEILDCSLKPVSSTADGDGIAIYGDDVELLDSEVSANTTVGGHCVGCYSPTARVRVKNCELDGRDSALTAGAGDGVYVQSGCASIEVRDCTMVRSANMAIEDNHSSTISAYTSAMYNNFAYGIVSSTAKYQVRNKGAMGESYGVDLVSGTPGAYSNVYIP